MAATFSSRSDERKKESATRSPGRERLPKQEAGGAPAGLPRFLGAPLQKKLAVGAVNSPLELEADRVAEQVSSGAPVSTLATGAGIQRKCDCEGGSKGECKKCREQRQGFPPAVSIQRRAGNGSDAGASDSPPVVHQVLRSPGKSLDGSVRATMEPRFGRDFSDVRVHTDSLAARSAQSVDALAYTAGNDVVFAEGQYSLESSGGRKLLAHELAHVVQQGGATDVLSRQPAHPGESAGFDPNAAVADFDRPDPNVDTVKIAPPPSYEPIPGQSPGSLYTIYLGGWELTNSVEQLTGLVDDLTLQYGIEAGQTLLYEVEGAGGRTAGVEVITRLLRQVVASAQQRYDALLGSFEWNARDQFDKMLVASAKALTRETMRYGLFEAPQPWLATQLSPVSRAELGELAAAAKLLLSKRKEVDSARQEEMLEHAGSYSEGLISEPIVEQYKDLHANLQALYPILARMGDLGVDPTPLSQLASGNEVDQIAALQVETDERWEDIDQTREGMDSGDHTIWELPPIIERTRAAMGIQPGSLQDKLIQGELERRASASFWGKIALGVLQLAGVVLAPFTAGVSLGLTIGIGLGMTYEDWKQYEFEKAAAGTDFDRAQSIATSDPSALGLAMDIVFVVFDVAGLGMEMRAASAAEKLARAEEAFREISPLLRKGATEAGGLTEETRAAIQSAAGKLDRSGALGERIVKELEAGTIGSEALSKAFGLSGEELSAFLKARSALRPEIELEEVAGDAIASAGNVHVNPKGWIFVCHSPCTVLREMYGELFAGDLNLFSRMEKLEARAARAAASGNKQELYEVARDANSFDAELRAFRTPARAEAQAGIASARSAAGSASGLGQNARNILRELDDAAMERILRAARGRNAINGVRGQLFEEFLNLQVTEARAASSLPLEFIPGWAIRGSRGELLTDGIVGFWSNGRFKIVKVFEAKASAEAATELIARGRYIAPARRQALFQMAQKRGIFGIFKENRQYSELLLESASEVRKTARYRLTLDEILSQHPDEVWSVAENTSQMEAGQFRSTAERLLETDEISAYGERIPIDYSTSSATLEGVVPADLSATQMQALSKGAEKMGFPTASFTQLGISEQEIGAIADSIVQSAVIP